MPSEKLPPYDGDAEASVIGSLLIDDQAIVRVSLVVKASDFFREANSAVYAACLALHERGEGINQITVAHELDQRGRLPAIGGAAYLAECVAQVPTSLHAAHYAGIVQRAALMRRLIQAGGRIAQLGYENSPEVDQVLSQAEEQLMALRDGQWSKGFTLLAEVLENCAAEMTAPRDEQHDGRRIMTGFADLDRALGGLHPSDLIILAGRPGHGKTSLVLNIAEQVSLQGGGRVGIFSLEMSREQLAYRLIAGYATVDLQQLRLWRLNESGLERVSHAIGVLSEAKIYIDDAAGQRVSTIRARAKQLASQYGVDLLIVDYAGLVAGSGKAQNRVQELGEVSRGLKALAKDLNVPVLLAAQLNRAVELRPDHRPQLSDLRESGDLEQDADVVLFIHRADQYSTEEAWQKRHKTEPYPKGVADIIIAKHRNGPTGEISLMFHEQSTRFRSLEIHRTEGDYYWQR